MNDSDGQIYLEPSMQIGYNKWDKLRHTEVNDTAVAATGANALFGRAGLRLSGVASPFEEAAQVQPFVSVDWLHDNATPRISTDNEVFQADIPQNRIQASAGASIKFPSGVAMWATFPASRAVGITLRTHRSA